MATVEELQAVATDPEKFQALLAAHVEESKAGLLRKNGELLSELTGAKKWRTALSDFGEDPDEIAAAVRKASELERKLEEERKAHKAGADPEEVDKLLEERLAEERERIIRRADEQVRKANEKAVAEEEARKTLSDRLVRTMNEQDLYRIAGHRIEPDLWKEFVGRLAQVMHRDENGELQLRDPKTGIALSGKNGDMTLEELVDGLQVSAGKEDWEARGSRFFKAGTGTGDHDDGPGSGRKRIPKGLKRSEMTPSQKVQFQRDHGAEAYRQLPE